MITPTSGSITVPSITYDGIWILDIHISAPSPTSVVSCDISVCPFSSISGDKDMSRVKFIHISDVLGLEATDANVNAVVTNIYAYVQNYITANLLF